MKNQPPSVIQKRIPPRPGDRDLNGQKIDALLHRISSTRSIPKDDVLSHLENIAAFDYQHSKPWPAWNPITKALCPDSRLHFPQLPEWADHHLIEKSNGETLYVCHPYHLDRGAFKDFAELEEAGLNVFVSGYSKYHLGALQVVIW